MQNIEIFIGSPRKNGNTHSLAQMLDQGLDNDKFSVNKTFLYDYDIKACTDCRACKKGNLICVVKDGMQELYPLIDDADILVFATPIYWFGPSAKTKLLLDRLRPYYSNKMLTAKKALLLLPAGVGESDCDLTIEMFRRSFETLGVEFMGSVAAQAYDIGEVNNDKKALASLERLVTKLNSLG